MSLSITKISQHPDLIMLTKFERLLLAFSRWSYFWTFMYVKVRKFNTKTLFFVDLVVKKTYQKYKTNPLWTYLDKDTIDTFLECNEIIPSTWDIIVPSCSHVQVCTYLSKYKYIWYDVRNKLNCEMFWYIEKRVSKMKIIYSR